jgi:hypothetical protein
MSRQVAAELNYVELRRLRWQLKHERVLTAEVKLFGWPAVELSLLDVDRELARYRLAAKQSGGGGVEPPARNAQLGLSGPGFNQES